MDAARVPGSSPNFAWRSFVDARSSRGIAGYITQSPVVDRNDADWSLTPGAPITDPGSLPVASGVQVTHRDQTTDDIGIDERSPVSLWRFSGRPE